MPPAMKDFLLEAIQEIPEGYTLICPVYYNPDHTWDIQIGGTGTGNSEENLIETCVREALEEFGLVIDPKDRSHFIRRVKIFNKEWFMCSSTEFKTWDGDRIFEDPPRDDYRKKVGFLFWSNEWEKYRIMVKENTDNIGNYVFLSPEDIRYILRFI